tara:strand:- start:202 stop:744 length:543 start_codon:yes stop_codon:yes gene_type:complete
MIVNIINLITLLRILLALIISLLVIMGEYYVVALVLFFFAGISDYLDGFLARKYNATSQIGEILDPIADKILIVFILITLSVNLSSFLLAFSSSLIISREIWVSALRDYCSRRGITNATKVTYLAKVKTSVQLFTISLYLLGLAINNMMLIVIGDAFLILSVLVTIYTGYEYTMNVIKSK